MTIVTIRVRSVTSDKIVVLSNFVKSTKYQRFSPALQATRREKPNPGAFVFGVAGVAAHLWWVIRTDLSKCVYSITYYTLYSWKYYTRAFIFHQECLITQPNTQLTTRHTLPFQLYPQFHNFNTQWENIGQGFQLLERWTKVRSATHCPDEQCRCT